MGDLDSDSASVRAEETIVYSKQLPAQRDSLVVFNKGAPTGKLKERDTLPSHVTASQKVRTRSGVMP